MHSVKKISALALALLMAVTMFVVPASAESVKVKGSVTLGELNVSKSTAEVFLTIPEGLSNVTGVEFALQLPTGISLKDVSSELATKDNGWGIDINAGKVLITAGNDGLDFSNKTVEKLLKAQNGKYNVATLTFSIASTVARGEHSAKITVLDIATGTGKTPHTNDVADSFKISLPKSNIKNATVSAISAKTYTGSAIKPAVTVKDGSKTLKSGTDYTVAYKNNTNAGTATVTITGKGNYTGTKTATFKINAKKVTPTVSGYKAKVYNGKAQKQTLTVKVGKTTLKASQYTVTYTNNKYVGKASVKVTLKGNYSGTKTVTFKINPKSTSLKSVAAGKKQFTAKWNKQATQTSGYQVQYSTNKNFKNAKTVTVTSTKTTSKTVKNLKAKTKYYVRVRTYKTVKNTKYYSAWSATKNVTTKK